MKNFFSASLPNVSIKHALAAGLCAALLSSSACSKKEEKDGAGSSGNAALSTKAADVGVVSTGLVNQIPENSVGYFSWDLGSPAYQKLKTSPWKGKAGNIETALQTLEKDSAVVRVLDKVFDLKKLAAAVPAETNVAEATLSKGVGFIVPPPPGSTEPSVGFVFESSAGDLGGKAAALKEALKAEKIAVSDLTLGEGQGYKFQVKEAEVKDLNLPAGIALPDEVKDASPEGGKKVDLFFAWKGNRGTFASNERLAGTLLATKPDKAPSITAKPLFTEATKGLGKSADQLVYGYLDVEEAAQSMPTDAFADPAAPAGAAANPAAEIPVRAVAASFSMAEAPENRANIVLNTTNLKFKPWIAALQNSSSAGMLPALPSNPLLFLSLDGKTISSLKQQALAMVADPSAKAEMEMAEKQLAFLNDIGRIGLAVKMGPLGQSMLPIPDIMILAESAKPDVTKTQLSQIVGMGMATAGLPGAEWKDKTIGGQPAKYLLTPFGLGVFVSSVDKQVLISTTEAQLDTAITAAKAGKGLFADSLNTRTKDALSSQPSVGTIYVNFTEVAGLVDSMGGMMQMYAPQGAGQNGQVLDPAQLEGLRQMGTLVATMSAADGTISLRSFYELPVSVAGAPKA